MTALIFCRLHKKGKGLYLSCNTKESSFHMSILSQLNLNFDYFLTKSFAFKCSDEYICTLISKTLEQFDLELAGTRRKSLKIIKKFHRTILTSKGKIKFKRQYY